MPWRLLMNMIEENSSLENTDNKKESRIIDTGGGTGLQGIKVNEKPIDRHQIEIPAGE